MTIGTSPRIERVIIVLNRFVTLPTGWYGLLANAVPPRYLAIAGFGLLGLTAAVVGFAAYCFFMRGK
ncbi:hypothetical protein [Burkholderia anthina]|uniref:hypothetical protein n=1 Tax=Burkholderia anthina TaxID=179879 RepID=UPI00158A0E68|nr:hypothetical protein [Burkholderia anthina]